MADPTKGEVDTQDPEGGEEQSHDPQKEGQQPQDTGSGEEQSHDTGTGEGNTVNRHKYDRDIANKDKEIASLKAQLKELNDAKAADGDQTAQLRKEMDDLKQQLADERDNASLAKAGCIDLDLARTALKAYGGDVAKLKEAKPYLFGGETDAAKRSTGGRPAGASPDDLRAKARRAAGLKD